MNDVNIYVSFRFNVNINYNPEEKRFLSNETFQYLKRIEYILDALDGYNSHGISVKGTWSFTNYNSLENIILNHSPELVQRIKHRVETGFDEIELVSYSGGLTSALTEKELRKDFHKAVSNENNTGLRDIFGKVTPIVRPHENMVTPGLIPLYKKVGMEAVSVLYSGIPFHGFSNFIPKLPVEKRFNPLWYSAPDVEDKIVLLPAISGGDVYDNLGFSCMLKELRREQLEMGQPLDMLFLVDMDAGDDFWQGYLNTAIKKELKLSKPLFAGGINYYIQQLSKLSFIEFSSPYDYLRGHPPVGEINVGQDLACGSFDGYASWADKLENTKLWSGIDRCRLNSEYALAISTHDNEIMQEVEENVEKLLEATNTYYFGPEVPLVAKPLIEEGRERIKSSIEKSKQTLNRALDSIKGEANSIRAVFPRLYYRGKGKKKGLIRAQCLDGSSLSGKGVELSFSRDVFGRREQNLIYSGVDEEIELERETTGNSSSVFVGEETIGNSYLELCKRRINELVLYHEGHMVTDLGSFVTSINYRGKVIPASDVSFEFYGIEGKAAFVKERGKVVLSKNQGKVANYEKIYMIAGDLPYLFVDMDISYPLTSDFGDKRKKVKKFNRGYDIRWQEIRPLEIVPAFRGSWINPIRVYKHNFLGDLNHYDFNYEQFSKNKEVDASNNAISCSFVSFAVRSRGILLAQSLSADNSFAFARARLKKEDDFDKLIINPFGVYQGEQLNSPVKRTGLVPRKAMGFEERCMSSAPSYRGGRQQFSLMIAPYNGEEPGEELINDAIMHTYPPFIYSRDEQVKMIDFTDWESTAFME